MVIKCCTYCTVCHHSPRCRFAVFSYNTFSHGPFLKPFSHDMFSASLALGFRSTVGQSPPSLAGYDGKRTRHVVCVVQSINCSDIIQMLKFVSNARPLSTPRRVQ